VISTQIWRVYKWINERVFTSLSTHC